MTKSEYRQQLTYYFEDIYKYFDSGDMKSCMIMVGGLSKLLVEYRKTK